MQDTGTTTTTTAARHGPMAAPGPGTDFVVILIGLTFLMNAVGRGATESFAVFLLPVENA